MFFSLFRRENSCPALSAQFHRWPFHGNQKKRRSRFTHIMFFVLAWYLLMLQYAETSARRKLPCCDHDCQYRGSHLAYGGGGDGVGSLETISTVLGIMLCTVGSDNVVLLLLSLSR